MSHELHPELESVLKFYLEQVKNPPNDFSHAPGLIGAPSFFSVETFQELLKNPLLGPEWIFLKARGRPVPLDDHSLFKQVQTKQLTFLDKAFINEQLRQGAALVLEGIDILNPGINAFSAQLDDALPCSLTNSVAFFSQAGCEAYQGHVDSDDVLVIQVSGEKVWNIFAPQPRRYAETDNLTQQQMGPKTGELVMRPGDVLYLRAGVPHMCRTSADHSLHLAFDLIDSTLSPKQITDEANRIYEHATADAYLPPDQVMEKYMEILNSPEFQHSMKNGTKSMKQAAKGFRKTIGKASVLDALSKYL